MNRLLLSLLFLSLVPLHSRAQLWGKTFPHRNVPFSDTILQQAVCCWDTARGGLVAYSMDATVRGGIQTHYVRINKRGDTLWTKRNLFRPNWEEVVSSVIQLPNGDFVLAAMTQDTLSGSHVDGHVIKRIDGNGNPLFTGLITFPKRRGDEHIQVLNGPNGGYYVVSSWWGITSNSTLGVDSVVGKIILQRYSAANVLLGTVNISNGDIAGYPWASTVCPSFPALARRPYFNAIKVLCAASALDGGFFAAFQCDTTLAFSPATCTYRTNAGAVAGGFVCKYNAGLNVVWRTHLSTALHLPGDSMFVTQRCVATSDSGLVVMGLVLDTTGRSGPDYTVVVKLNKSGVVTKVIRITSLVALNAMIETSLGRIMFAASTWDRRWGWIDAVAQFDRNLDFVNYNLLQVDSPGFSLNHAYHHDFSCMVPNQYGGAFLPYYVDSVKPNPWLWLPRHQVIPAALNIDSSGLFYGSIIAGKVIEDNNHNCIEDAGIDKGLNRYMVKMQDTGNAANVFYAFADKGGYWTKPVGVGVYNVMQVVPSHKRQICPALGFRNVDASVPGKYPGYMFYDTLRPGIKDLKVSLNTESIFRAGNSAYINAYVTNNSSQPLPDTLQVVIPAGVYYLSAVPSPSSVNGRTLKWSLANLATDDMLAISIHLYLSSSLGTSTSFTASIAEPSDANPADNTDTLLVRVVRAYDPNVKSINRPEFTTARKDWIYTVAFQNTGTSYAQDVLIVDGIDPLLDPATFKVLNSSHPLTNVSWESYNQVHFRFDNIYLPDSGHNQGASHGFITYAINPRKTVHVGDQISNTAAIFFDYNPPVYTNTTRNFITEAPLDAGAPPITRSSFFSAFPNPTTGTLTIRSASAGEATLYDMQGRSLMQLPVVAGEKRVRLPDGLAPGIYLLQGRSTGGENLGALRIVMQ